MVIYPADHRPAHVHVIGEGGEAVFNLGCPDGPTMLRENRGFPLAAVRTIARDLAHHRAHLCESWRTIHG
ncbi:DUF4160 domain-containing protein [Methylobacterium sp. Gmos1]